MKKKKAIFMITAGVIALTASAPFTARAAEWVSDETGARYEKADGNYVDASAESAEGRTDENGTSQGQNRDLALEAVDRVNEKRAKKNLKALSVNDELMAAAEERAEELVGKFAHVRPDGSSAVTVLKEAGLSYSRWGENIAAGYYTSENVTEAWMDSPRHKESILTAVYEETGLACFVENGTAYWVQIFYTE